MRWMEDGIVVVKEERRRWRLVMGELRSDDDAADRLLLLAGGVTGFWGAKLDAIVSVGGVWQRVA